MNTPFVVHSAGVELAVEMFGQGPPLLFAHGLTGNRQTTERQLAPLSDAYTVVVYDQRGHGDSSPLTDPAGYDWGQMAEDMGRVMEAAGVERAVVGGESMGAATALLFALRHPERVERLLLTAPAFGDRANSEIDRFRELAAVIRAVGLEKFVLLAGETWRRDFGWPEDVVSFLGGAFLSHDSRSLAAAIDSVIGWVPLPTLDVLERVACPTCIVYWENDPLHPADLALRMVEALPNARAVRIPPPPYIFSEPHSVGRIYQEFLRGIP